MLLEQLSQRHLYLGSLHIFGRNPSRADTVLLNNDASQIHASIRWNGIFWEIFDHSRNGTLIDKHTLLKNCRMTLVIGQSIRFAAGAKLSWQVINLDAPCPMLLPVNHGKSPIALGKLLLLPNVTAPEASLLQNSDGQWQWEDADGCSILMDGDKVQIAGDVWEFFNKLEVDATTDINTCGEQTTLNTLFCFSVSQDEEHTQLTLTIGEQQVNLGERSHHYSLLTLARIRLSDAARGFDTCSQGWIGVEQCAAMQGIEPKHLNMLLHRARHQIAQAFSMDIFCNCIERRRGELRFGDFRFQIIRGSQIEARFEPVETRGDSPTS